MIAWNKAEKRGGGGGRDIGMALAIEGGRMVVSSSKAWVYSNARYC